MTREELPKLEKSRLFLGADTGAGRKPQLRRRKTEEILEFYRGGRGIGGQKRGEGTISKLAHVDQRLPEAFVRDNLTRLEVTT